MATYDLNAARQAGVSDDAILSELSSAYPKYDVAGALKAGISKQDIITELAAGPPVNRSTAPPQDPASQGAWAYAKSLGTDLMRNVGRFMDPSGLGMEQIGQDMLSNARTQLNAAGQSITGQSPESQGKVQPLQAFNHLVGAIPFVAPLEAAGRHLTTPGQRGAGLVDAAALLAPKIGEGAGNLMSRGAEGVYDTTMNFPKSVGLEASDEALNYGFEGGIPRTRAGIPKATDTINDIEGRIQSTLAQRPSAKINVQTVVKPLEDLRDAQPLYTEYGDAMRSAIQKRIDTLTNRLGSANISPAAALNERRAVTGNLSKNAYSDTNPGGESISRELDKATESGLRDAIVEQFPEADADISKMSNGIKLRDALIDAAKTDRGGATKLKTIINMGLGAVTGAGSLIAGHPVGAAISTISVPVALHILSDPRLISQVAVAFRNSPQVLGALGFTGQAARVLSDPNIPVYTIGGNR